MSDPLRDSLNSISPVAGESQSKLRVKRVQMFALTAGQLRAACDGCDCELAKGFIASVAKCPDSQEVVVERDKLQQVIDSRPKAKSPSTPPQKVAPQNPV